MPTPAQADPPLPDALDALDRGSGPPSWLPFTDWNWRHYAFYLGVPAVITVYAALNNWAVLQVAGYERALLFYAGHGFLPWWVSAAASYACMRLLSPWRPHQLLVLVLGSMIASLITWPYAHWITEYFAQGWMQGDADGRRTSEHIFSYIGFWSGTVRATVIWVGVNLLFDRLVGLPRYRGASSPAAATGEVAPTPGASGTLHPPDLVPSPADPSLRFLQRLPTAVPPSDVIALKAEQHYIRVYTPSRSFLTLYRFSDALAELDAGTGCQVHRSYWVRYPAIRSLRRRDRKYFLELANGIEVPVSAGHLGMIREVARTRGIPVHPSA